MKNKYLLIFLPLLLIVFLISYYFYPKQDISNITITASNWVKYKKEDYDKSNDFLYKAIRFKDEKYCSKTSDKDSCLQSLNDNISLYDLRLKITMGQKISPKYCDSIKSLFIKDQCKFIISNNDYFVKIVKSANLDLCKNIKNSSLCKKYISNNYIVENNIEDCMKIEDNQLLYRCEISKYIIDLKNKDLCYNLLSMKLQDICLKRAN